MLMSAHAAGFLSAQSESCFISRQWQFQTKTPVARSTPFLSCSLRLINLSTLEMRASLCPREKIELLFILSSLPAEWSEECLIKVIEKKMCSIVESRKLVHESNIVIIVQERRGIWLKKKLDAAVFNYYCSNSH